MIKRTIHIGNPAYLKVENAQLVIDSVGEKNTSPHYLPIEDIGLLILENRQITITHGLLAALMANNTAVVSCDGNQMPTGLMLPLEGHTEMQEKTRFQLSCTEPLRKNLWQQIISAKISNQAAHLKELNRPNPKVERLMSQVKSGDPDNLEAQASAYYWRSLFGENWLRSYPEGAYPNNLLNYGYAILRAITARAIVGAGLLPFQGIFHKNKYNAYCLADDLMEPYRPLVDKIVFQMAETGEGNPLDKEAKSKLLKIPVMDIDLAGEKSPCLVAVQRSAASLAKCYMGISRKLLLPKL